MTEDMKKILIVEDNPGDVYLIKEILKRYKPGVFDVTSAERLDEGLAILEHEALDLILLDMNLPDSHGMKTVIAVKEKAPDVALVVLTGDEDEQLGMDAVKHGAQDFLVKGKVPGFILVRVIGYAMERQAAEKKLRESELFLRSTLDALSAHIAIIDERGIILAVNEAWRTFARKNQGDLTKVCEGSNYFAA
jgi:CheY-like chemotaxis protein